MAYTFELFDGSTTLNLKDTSNYDVTSVEFGDADERQETFAGNELRRVKFLPHRVEATLNILGTDTDDLAVNIRAITNMLRVTEDRQVKAQGTKAVLKYQLGGTDSKDITQRVLSGSLIMPDGRRDGVLHQVNIDQNIVVNARLSLLLEPMGRLADETPSTATLENEQDGANLNHMELTSLVGTSGGRLELKIHDANNGGGTPWNGSKKMWIGKRSGERRTDALTLGAPDSVVLVQTPTTVAITHDSATTGGVTTNASGGASALLGFTNDSGSNKTERNDGQAPNAYAQWDISTLPKGRYRVLCRASAIEDSASIGDKSHLSLALGTVFGGFSSIPATSATIGEGDWEVGRFDASWSDDEWHIMDLGELLIPVIGVPSGSGTDPTLNLRIYLSIFTNGQTNWATTQLAQASIDDVFLLPVDEGVVIVDSVGTNDRVLISNKEDVPGVWLLDGSDVVQSFATFNGGPFNLGPEDTRIYWLRDDTGDPTTIQAVLTPKYTPLIQGI